MIIFSCLSFTVVIFIEVQYITLTEALALFTSGITERNLITEWLMYTQSPFTTQVLVNSDFLQ